MREMVPSWSVENNDFEWTLPARRSYKYTSVSDVTVQGIFDEVGFNDTVFPFLRQFLPRLMMPSKKWILM